MPLTRVPTELNHNTERTYSETTGEDPRVHLHSLIICVIFHCASFSLPLLSSLSQPWLWISFPAKLLCHLPLPIVTSTPLKKMEPKVSILDSPKWTNSVTFFVIDSVSGTCLLYKFFYLFQTQLNIDGWLVKMHSREERPVQAYNHPSHCECNLVQE